MYDTSANEVLDEGLTRLAATGPEFRGGLSNHGPMATEALVRLGRADAIERWLDGYLKRLDDPPAPSARITDQTWRESLGSINRVADWDRYFGVQLAEEPWRDVLARWWPRLLPGLAAAATHGVIRTSHAARSLAAAEQAGAGTAGRTSELGRGLAYWAARYLELPGRPRTEGRLDLAAAVSGLPVAAREPAAGLIFETLKAELADQPGFGAAVSALREPTDVPADLAALAREFARVFLVYGRGAADRAAALRHRPGCRPVGAAAAAGRGGAPYLRRPVAGRGRALRRLHRRHDPRAAARRPAAVARRADRPRRRHRRRARHQADRGVPAAGRRDARSAAAPRGGPGGGATRLA